MISKRGFKLNIHGILLVTLSSNLYCDSIEIVRANLNIQIYMNHNLWG